MNNKTQLTRRRLRGRATGALAAAVLGATLLAACGSSQDAANSPASGATVHVFQFMPSPLTVKAGTEVTWTNQDAIAHTVTAGTPEAPATTFDLSLDGKGTTGTFTFAKPGTYLYFCQRHNVMRGEIRVA